jgi:hypothetical protein
LFVVVGGGDFVLNFHFKTSCHCEYKHKNDYIVHVFKTNGKKLERMPIYNEKKNNNNKRLDGKRLFKLFPSFYINFLVGYFFFYSPLKEPLK